MQVTWNKITHSTNNKLDRRNLDIPLLQCFADDITKHEDLTPLANKVAFEYNTILKLLGILIDNMLKKMTSSLKK